MSSTASSSALSSVSQRPWLLATVVALALGAGYTLYFDYKRRADPKFRRQLRKQAKKVAQTKPATDGASAAAAGAVGVGAGAGDRLGGLAADDDAASVPLSAVPGLAEFLATPMPEAPEDKETFFMELLSKGENLAKLGPQFYEVAATCFYKALKVYPAPAELVMLYQRTVAPPVFELIMTKVADEVKHRQEQYFVEFPPANYNVRVRAEDDPTKPALEDGSKPQRRLLVATKDFAVGDAIFTEEPLVASILPANVENESHCSYCLATAAGATAVSSDRTGNTYCSESCRDAAWTAFEELLYADHAAPGGSTTKTFAAKCVDAGTQVPLSMARFLAQMVKEDMARQSEPAQEVEEYGAWDHIERLKYLDLQPTAEDTKFMDLLQKSLGAKVPGLSDFLTEERYMMLKGKLLYNQYAVVASRTPATPAQDLGTMRYHGDAAEVTIGGSGIYPVASYLGHQCEPNTRIEPVGAGAAGAVRVVAAKPVAKGDVLSVAYIDTAAPVADRAVALKKWRFTCPCSKCTGEQLEVDA
ncbi:hypothetical protein BC828DRAFT_403370 [Blastocladiella britannica]|nr:hypothetical protein BC828DRAFT_403370 [Blastocladiella britannica]